MYIPYDERLGIHPQDNYFLQIRRNGMLKTCPEEKFPLYCFTTTLWSSTGTR